MTIVTRLRSLVDLARDALYPERIDRTRRELFVVHVLRLSIQVGRQLLRDRLPIQAAALSFQTLLSVVPLFVVAFWGWKVLRGEPDADALVRALTIVLPRAAEPAARTLARITASVDTGALGLVGIGSLVVLSFTMLLSMEKVFCDIWRVRATRPLLRRLVSFWAVLTLSPLLLGIGIRYGGVFIALPAVGTLGASFSLTAGALFLSFKLLPATRVRTAPALLGAIVSGLLFEASKLAFGLYAGSVATTYVSVYGAIAFFPIFCVWVYVSWLVVLFGVELAYTKQHLYLLWERDRRNLALLEADEPLYRKVGPKLALRVLLAIAERFAAGGGPTPRDDLAVRYRTQADAIDAVIDVLAGAGVLLRVGEAVLPSRPLAQIGIAEVYGLFEPQDVASEPPTSGDAILDEIFGKVGGAARDAATATTVADLVTRASLFLSKVVPLRKGS